MPLHFKKTEEKCSVCQQKLKIVNDFNFKHITLIEEE